MYYNNSAQTRTFKILEEDKFSAEDVTWIRSIENVCSVAQQKKIIRVLTEKEDAIGEIINAINRKYCNCLKPKLSPLF